MSMLLMVKAMNAKVGNPARKLVLLKLADCASDSGECFPSYQHIADHCEMSRRAVIDHINALKKEGFLCIEKRKCGKENRSNIFHLTIEKGVEKSGENSAPPSENSALPPSENSAPPSANSAPITSQLTSNSFYPVSEPRERAHNAPETQNANFENAHNSQNRNCADKNFPDDFADQKTETQKSVLENPNEPKQTKSKTSRLEAELKILAEIGVTGQIAEDHLAIRKAKRVPLTLTAAKQMAKDAADCGLTPSQAIEIAIGYGWASFRADWFFERQNGFSGSLKNNTAQPKNRINQIPHHPEGLQNVFLAKDIF